MFLLCYKDDKKKLFLKYLPKQNIFKFSKCTLLDMKTLRQCRLQLKSTKQ